MESEATRSSNPPIPVIEQLKNVLLALMFVPVTDPVVGARLVAVPVVTS